MTDCIHNDKRDLVDCTTELLAARKEVMRLNSLMAGKVLAETSAAIDVLAERQRQTTKEGWTPEHDDEHKDGELTSAAACYAVWSHHVQPPALWPWDAEWWKPKGKRRDLVRAAALILAEIERLDRQSTN